MPALIADPSWRAEVRDEGLVVHGGADSVYLLPDVPASVATELASLFGDRPPSVDALTPDARLLVPQLRGIGALCLDGVVPPSPSVALRVVSGGGEAIEAELVHCGLTLAAEADLVVVLRTDGPLRALLPVAEELAASRRPHLLCDVASRRTVVLGPLVVPGLTACLSCLAGRLANRWGDPDPPSRPAALSEPVLVAALVARAVRAIGRSSYELVERTVALDLDSVATTSESVLPASECPVCPRVDPVGVRLPWEERE